MNQLRATKEWLLMLRKKYEDKRTAEVKKMLDDGWRKAAEEVARNPHRAIFGEAFPEIKNIKIR